jgi:hypothetical protein
MDTLPITKQGAVWVMAPKVFLWYGFGQVIPIPIPDSHDAEDTKAAEKV